MTARLPRGTWLEGGAVHLDDAHGWPTTIPARVAHLMLQTAKNNDDGRAVWGLRPFDRDTLQGAVDLLDARPTGQCSNCNDAPATTRVGDNNDPFCDGCASAAQGSIHDDKTEF